MAAPLSSINAANQANGGANGSGNGILGRRLPFDCAALDEIDAGDADGFNAAAAANKAVVIRGLAARWTLVRELARAPSDLARVDLLQRFCRLQPAFFTEHRTGYLHYGENYRAPEWSFFSRIGFFRKFAGRLRDCIDAGGDRIVYMQAIPMRLLPGLRRRISPVPWMDRVFSAPCSSNFWIGSGGHVVNSHFDLKNNLVCMIAGVKRIVVAPPTLIPDMYLAAFDRGIGGAVSSLARLLEFDVRSFPRLANCVEKLRMAILEPGDAIYIPPCWWHHVESFGLNVMANAWKDFLPLRTESRWVGSIMKSIALMSELTAEQKAPVRDLLAGVRPPDALTGVVPEDARSAIVEHIASTRAMYRVAGTYFEGVGTLLHDYYVFDRFGPPVPLPPGERARMIARFRASDTRGRRHPIRRHIRTALRNVERHLREGADWPVAATASPPP